MSALIGINAFPPKAIESFQTYLQASTNCSIFDPARRASYRNWLSNPEAPISKMLPKKERACLRSEKRRALHDFILKNNQLYRKGSKRDDDRVVTMTYDAVNHITRAHDAIGYAGARKTHQRLMKEVYGISQDNIEALLPGCKICAVNHTNNTKPPLEPIVAIRVLERVQINLIDFRHQPDGRFKWIMHIKDHVSKFSALFTQTSKEASECATSLSIFIKFLGDPEICQSDNGREFKGALLILLKRHSIKIVYGRLRTPRTQGLVEQGNSVMKDKLRKWVCLQFCIRTN